MASLFIFARVEEEMAGESCRGELDLVGLQQRRKIHFLVVYAVTQHEPYTILKVTQDTTATEVSVDFFRLWQHSSNYLK